MNRIVRKPPGDKPDYYIATATSGDGLEDVLKELQELVNAGIVRGYDPIGGHCITVEKDFGSVEKNTYLTSHGKVTEYEQKNVLRNYIVTQAMRLVPVS